MRLLSPLQLLVAMLLFVMAPTCAWAHAQLLSTSPGANAVLEVAPDQVELGFNEPVSPLTTRLIAPDGSSRDVTQSTQGGKTVTVELPEGLVRGTHVVSWRVVSADGHPVGGSLIFSVGQITGAAAEQPTGDRFVSILLWGSKLALFIALFAGVGGAAFAALAPVPRRARLLSFGLCIAGLLVAPLTLGLQGLDALGLSLAALADPNSWSVGFSTSYGLTTLAAVFAFAAALFSFLISRSIASGLIGLLAAAVAALSLALSGHASAAAPQWLTRPAVFFHAAGVLFWIGALLPLWLLLRDRSTAADRALANFSRYIPYVVGPLVVSGFALAVIQLGAPGPHWLTPYGYILAGKLALLFVLFCLALWNRGWLTKPALAGDARAHARLRRSIGLEMVLVVLILALVSGWRFTPPPRALTDLPAAEPIMVHLTAGDTMAMVLLSPGSSGPVTLDTMITDLAHVHKDADAVSLTLSNSAVGIEPITQDAVWLDGVWRVDGITIPVPGTWQIKVEVRLSRFQLIRAGGEIVVP